jgi:hypothetical protein
MFECGFGKGTKKARGLRAESACSMCNALIKSPLLSPPNT